MFFFTKLNLVHKFFFEELKEFRHNTTLLGVEFKSLNYVNYETTSNVEVEDSGYQYYFNIKDIRIVHGWNVTIICEDHELDGITVSWCKTVRIWRAVDLKEFFHYVYILKLWFVELLEIATVESIWYSSCDNITYDSCSSKTRYRRGTLLRNVTNLRLVNGHNVRLELSDTGLLSLKANNIESFTIWIKKNIESDFFKD